VPVETSRWNLVFRMESLMGQVADVEGPRNCIFFAGDVIHFYVSMNMINSY